MKTYTLIARALLVLMLARSAFGQSVDRRFETNPNWPPTATQDTERFYAKRVGLGRTPFQRTKESEVAGVAPNPKQAVVLVDATNLQTTKHDLDMLRKDGQAGTGYYSLHTDPREASADRTGRTLTELALGGRWMNTDPASSKLLRNSSRALNRATIRRSWDWAWGSARFIRIEGNGGLVGSMNAGESKADVEANCVGIFFGRSRQLVGASLRSLATPTATGVKTAELKVSVLGYALVSERITETKPFVKNLRHWSLAPARDWWSGSLAIPWLNLNIAFKMTSDPLVVRPRIALGNASAAGEVALQTGLETFANLDLFSIWGFAKLACRIHFRPFDGSLVGGSSIGLAWDGSKPLLRDARYARVDVSYGQVQMKVKAVFGFSLFGWNLGSWDKTLFTLFQHDGRSIKREVVSYVSDSPIR